MHTFVMTRTYLNSRLSAYPILFCLLRLGFLRFIKILRKRKKMFIQKLPKTRFIPLFWCAVMLPCSLL